MLYENLPLFTKFGHLAHIQITPQHISLKTRITLQIVTALLDLANPVTTFLYMNNLIHSLLKLLYTRGGQTAAFRTFACGSLSFLKNYTFVFYLHCKV